MSDNPGSIGRYEVIELLGRGAIGAVYKCRDPQGGRLVAIKTVSLSEIIPEDQREDFLERFFRESRVAKVLKHPNVIEVLDVDQVGGRPFMVLEYLGGGSLTRLIKEKGPLPVARGLSIARQVAAGLAYAHRLGLIHRDIKPDNILLDTEGRAVITDFGAAHLRTSELTRTGEVLGTPHYMSPEQILGGELDGRSDLFSLGVVLYLMLTGQRPFKGDTVSTACYHIVHSPPEPIDPVKGVPREVVDLLNRLLAKNREHRLSSGEEVMAALDALDAESSAVAETWMVGPGEAPRAAPDGVAEAGGGVEAASPVAGARSFPRWWLWATAGVIGLLVVLVAGGILSARWLSQRRAPPSATGGGPEAAPVAPSAEASPDASTDAATPAETSPAAPPADVSPGVKKLDTSKDFAATAGFLSRDASAAESLAQLKQFDSAFRITDRFPGRLKELERGSSRADAAALAAVRDRVRQAEETVNRALADWAKVRLDKGLSLYAAATAGGRPNAGGVALAYAEVRPVLAWRDRLPQDQRDALDTFARQCRGRLTDEEWAKAQAGG